MLAPLLGDGARICTRESVDGTHHLPVRATLCHAGVPAVLPFASAAGVVESQLFLDVRGRFAHGFVLHLPGAVLAHLSTGGWKLVRRIITASLSTVRSAVIIGRLPVCRTASDAGIGRGTFAGGVALANTSDSLGIRHFEE